MQLEVRHLRALDTVARHASVTRAAAVLGVSQPALTMQLRRIERLLGGELFARGPQGVMPTAFGDFVLARARAALADVDDILAARPPAPGVSTVRVGGFESRLLIGLIGRLEAALPGAHVTVHAEYSTRLLLDLIAAHRLDLALVSDYPGHELRPPPPVRHDLVAVEPVFVALAAGHRLAARAQIDLADLAGEEWVLPPSDGTGWPEHFLEACAARRFTPDVRYRMVDAETKRELIATGRAVGPCQATFEPERGVVVRPLTGDPVWMRHLVTWDPAGPLTGPGEPLVRLAREAHAAVAGGCPAYLDWLTRRGRSVGASWAS
ncbi:LysR family transcriptional regulator [Actinomadura alba]|uniref:LysR family transcriptional regulator n=1 Tax=Actinomadura alba TaxID=406431 RepID=A0ABR7LST1_9ACTN|nr:LysR family transcriptional regulator [Actinomadura alba]MBC6467639.1 LysR family transcriptional regulator [Actinomadura alba]